MSDVVRLLDTNIIVDVMRGYPPAVSWFSTMSAADFGLPGYAVMELMAGCTNKQAMRQVKKLTSQFPVYWPTDRECNLALDYFERLHLSHSIGILDALIGACAISLGVPLCTLNVKDFKAIPGLEIEQPYKR